MTDPIADYLTRLRNAIKANHRVVEVPASNLKKEITKVLFEKGYILNYKFVEEGPQGSIKIALKYDPVNKVNAIKKLIRVSTPGLRKYTGYKEMPRVLNGLGIAILSTSKGVMTDKEAVAEKGIEAEIEYITDMARIMEYGIMSTPALMIDNKVVSMGRVLKA
ncbi:MAG: 30S ribosomal protein S8, partial [Paludibacteraceae bacterium]|nr:30S ribosomal protein S8 [Paludibacteraceae bacterium]